MRPIRRAGPSLSALLFLFLLLVGLASLPQSQACPVCDSIDTTSAPPNVNPDTSTDVVLTRHVRRMQPDAVGAITGPTRDLEWGTLNFLHTTDTHGWLAGHVKEQNYGADWGDWLTFVTRMRSKADAMGVDLLVVDTGDLHDGNGLTDVTTPNGWLAMRDVWEKIGASPVGEENDDDGKTPVNTAGYDLLTIGNHELYVAEISYYHFANFTRVFGDRYITSNVQIRHPETNQWVDLGSRYRYFTTKHGVRIMAFGVIFDFKRNSGATVVTTASDMVRQAWFIEAINTADPVDLFVILGHNPTTPTDPNSTFETVIEAIRRVRPDVPIQVFGGHSHIRDFTVYDNRATGIESGQYCETVGWLSVNGVNGTSPAPTGDPTKFGYSPPSRPAVPANKTSYYNQLSTDPKTDPVYSRRYLDWNRRTLEFHAQDKSGDATFDTSTGLDLSNHIYQLRHRLNLTSLYGCAPRTYCRYCRPFMHPGNIFTLVTDALSKVVFSKERGNVPRFVYINTGSIRYELPKGPFTLDDSYILSPFGNRFVFIPDVPFEAADQILSIMNRGPHQRKRSDGAEDHQQRRRRNIGQTEVCADPPIIDPTRLSIRADIEPVQKMVRIVRIQDTDQSFHNDDDHTAAELTPGRTTTDDFGDDGDDTPHSSVPDYKIPNDVMANASFPIDGSIPDRVDVVFAEFVQPYILAALAQLGLPYTDDNVSVYNASLNSNSYIGMYVKQSEEWQKDMPNCPIGGGVGSD